MNGMEGQVVKNFMIENGSRAAPDFSLYAITDRRIFSAQCSMYFAVESALEAGLRAVQLREKDLSVKDLMHMATWMRDLTREYDAKLFINERVDVALAVEADGVHLGHAGMPPSAVRQSWGDKLIIGFSAHSVEEAIAAEREGADFITLGPVFDTPSKRKYGDPIGTDIIGAVKAEISIPVLAIGGITPLNAAKVREAGADGVAAISAIFGTERIGETVEEFLRLLK